MRAQLILVIALVLPACYTAPATRMPSPQVTVTHAGFDQVWGSVLTIFTDASIPIENMERAPGFIRSGEMIAT